MDAEQKEYYRKMKKEHRSKRKKYNRFTLIGFIALYATLMGFYGIRYLFDISKTRKYGTEISFDEFKIDFERNYDSLHLLEPSPNATYESNEKNNSNLKLVIRVNTDSSTKRYLTYKTRSNSKNTNTYDFESAIYNSKGNDKSVLRITTKKDSLANYNKDKHDSRHQVSEVFGKETYVEVDQIQKTYKLGAEKSKAEYDESLISSYKYSLASKLSYKSYKTEEKNYKFFKKNKILTMTSSSDDYSVDSGLGFKVTLNTFKVYRFHLDEDKPKLESLVSASGTLYVDKEGKRDGKTYYEIEYKYSYKKVYKIKKVDKNLREYNLSRLTLLE